MTEEKKITYLTNDDKIRNQEWVCLSFITPELVENCKVRGVKVRGVYSTEDEAKNRCKELQQIDPDFNIYIAPVGCWLPWSDDPEKAELILRKRGYGEPGEVLYRFEVPEPVTPIEETLKSDRGKSLIEYVIDYVVGKEGE